jgi:PAS domain S-box-containing protein
MEDSHFAVLDSVSDPFFALDAEGRFVYANRRAARVFGKIDGSDLVGRTVWEVYPPAVDSPFQRSLEHAREEGEATDFEFRYAPADAWYEGRAYPSGTLVSVYLREVTARRREAQALHQHEERFRLMVEGLKDHAIILLDRDGRIIEWNPGAERVKGYKAAEVLGRPWTLFYRAEDQVNRRPEWVLEQALKKGHHEDEGWRVRKDGSLFWANVVVTALRNEEGQVVGFAKFTRDLTERHGRKRSTDAGPR